MRTGDWCKRSAPFPKRELWPASDASRLITRFVMGLPRAREYCCISYLLYSSEPLVQKCSLKSRRSCKAALCCPRPHDERWSSTSDRFWVIFRPTVYY